MVTPFVLSGGLKTLWIRLSIKDQVIDFFHLLRKEKKDKYNRVLPVGDLFLTGGKRQNLPVSEKEHRFTILQ